MSLKGKYKVVKWAVRHRKRVKALINEAYKGDKKRARQRRALKKRVAIIRSSKYFDEEWYRRNCMLAEGVDAAEHYLKHGAPRWNPSADFCSEEYWDLNLDVRRADENPLLHYEVHGKYEGREIHTRDSLQVRFPDEAVECAKEFSLSPVQHARIAVLSCYFGNGIIPETLLFLIRGLKEVVDNIVLVGDCKVIPTELEKVKTSVCCALFERHGQYDFGSYKRGLDYIRQSNLLELRGSDELVFLNDSCFGPVFPFSETFDPMTKHFCDFWGYTNSKLIQPHIQSYFIVFKKRIVESSLLDDFLTRVEGPMDRGLIIETCETQLAQYLMDNGMFGAVVADVADRANFNSYTHPLTFLEQYRVPLVKKKAFTRKPKESLEKTLEIIKENAPEIADYITISEKLPEAPITISLEEHRCSLKETERIIKEKMESGEVLKTIFLVDSVSMFAAKPLCDCMMADRAFTVSIVVVPDFRKGANLEANMEKCEEDLLRMGYPKQFVKRACMDRVGRWEDMCVDADFVCYGLAYYNATSYRYTPYYSIGRSFLPIMVNYGFYRSIYDRNVLALDIFSYVWKAFFECEETLREYEQCSPINGDNASLVGYMKMDSLDDVVKSGYERKRVLVALHHSVDGGFNDTLALANFVRYVDYFRALPDEYPDIDFVFRPHPFLIDSLKGFCGWTDYEARAFVREMECKSNVVWCDGGDYFQEFADCDACIQDCGSFLVEYFYTGKPCCYMLKTPQDIERKFAPLGKECLEQCYISYSTDDIDSFIVNVVVGGDDPKASGREALARRIMVNYPHAAEAALDDIKASILGLAV